MGFSYVTAQRFLFFRLQQRHTGTRKPLAYLGDACFSDTRAAEIQFSKVRNLSKMGEYGIGHFCTI